MERDRSASAGAQKDNYSTGIRSGVFGMIGNAMLFVAKLTVGILIRSIAVTADAFNNLSDGASSVITVVGYKLSARPADREHPFGHARFEYIAALIVSVVMLMIGVLFLKESLAEIFSKKSVTEVYGYVYVVLGLSVLVKGAQAAVYGISYRKTRSLPMKAAATDSVGDMLATSAALISALLRQVTGADTDGWFGAAISAFILFSAVRLLRDSVSPLLGTSSPESLVRKIKESILSYDGVLGVHDLTIHSYGEAKIYAVAHVEVGSTMSLTSAHELIDLIERKVLADLGVQLVAHIDPRDEEKSATDLESLIRAYLTDRFHGLSLHDFRVTKEEGAARIYLDAELPWEESITADNITAALREFDPGYEYFVAVDHR